MQTKSLPFRMEQRSEHLGSTRGQNKKREIVSVRKRSLSGPNYSNLPTDRTLVTCLHLRKAQPSLLHRRHTNAKLVLGTDWRRQAAISDTYHCLQASENLRLSLPLTRHTPAINSEHQSPQKPPPEQPEGLDIHNNPSVEHQTEDELF